MIVHLPTFDALNTTALRLHFRAWRGIIDILSDFDQMHGRTADKWVKPDLDLFSDERAEYLILAQEDFHAILSIVQQANEIALKARIAAVSPYLLLLNQDVKFSSANETIEFASLRTLDAVDLPRAVNTLTPNPVSDTFSQSYSALRVQRNQYTHLGDTSIILSPSSICAQMIGYYAELWAGRPWFSDRVHFTHGREGFFDGKHWSPLQEILHSLEYDRALIPTARFKKLFGAKKSDVRFGCHQCQNDWAVRRNGPALSDAATAFYVKNKGVMHCLMCNEDFPAEFKACDSGKCDGTFAAPDDADYGAGLCFSCGH